MVQDTRRTPSVRFIACAVLLMAAIMAPGGLSVRAAVQDDRAGAGPYPAHIHAGTCDELGEVEFPLTDATQPEGEDEGTAPSLVVTTSTTTIETTLDELLLDAHALNVHMGADDMGTYVACGDVGGVVLDGELVIGLGELNDSGLSGVAILRIADDSTDVEFYLTQAAGDDGGAAGTPASSPAASPAASGDDVTVEIVDFAFGEGTLEVADGTTVRWVNNDSAPHTVTSLPGGDDFQSETLREGDEFTYTFTEAGSFEYFCEFHGNMAGTVIVT